MQESPDVQRRRIRAAYAHRVERMKASEIRELLKLLDRPGVVSFAGGNSDPALFPVEAMAEAYRDASPIPSAQPRRCNIRSARVTRRSAAGSRATWRNKATRDAGQYCDHPRARSRASTCSANC